MKFLRTFLSFLTIAGWVGSGEGKRDRLGLDSRNPLDVRLEVPRVVRVGETVVMKCLYDLGGDSLYTMKWYKGPNEFYRYTPKEEPKVRTFPSPGLTIDLSASNATQLTLKRVDLNLSARYSCEVTTDFPNVIAQVKSAEIRVIAYPERKPEIILLLNKRRYSIGDVLEANCSSYRSKPAANLTWFINDKKVRRHIPHDIKYRDVDNTESSRSKIRVEIHQSDFVHGQLKLTCLAEIQDHYHQTSEVIIYEEDRPKISSVVDNSSSTGSGGSNWLKASGTSSGAARSISHPPSTCWLSTLLVLIMTTIAHHCPSVLLPNCRRRIQPTYLTLPSSSFSQQIS